MNYKIKNTDERLSCCIGYDRKTWFRSQVPCAYDTETAAYAACRMIRHLPPVRDRLIAEAVSLGLGSGRQATALQRRIHTRAAALSLPGGEAWIYLTVRQGAIQIRGVRVEKKKPRT